MTPSPRWIGFALAPLAVSIAAPASAQIFDSDNLIVLSRQHVAAGYNDVWGFVGTDGREYVIQGTTMGTEWWDVDDPAHPVRVKTIAGPTSAWRDMFVIDDHAVVGVKQ